MAKKIPLDVDKKPMKPRKVKRNGIGTHGQKRVEWEPTARQWAMYLMVRQGKSFRSVGAEFELHFTSVQKMCQRVDVFLGALYRDKVLELRVSHTVSLEHVFSEAMTAWEKSKEPGITETSGDTPKGPTSETKKVYQCGNPAFLGEARSALADIRKIHCVDKNPKVMDLTGDESDDRVAGRERNQVIQERIEKLTAHLKANQEKSGPAAEQAG